MRIALAVPPVAALVLLALVAIVESRGGTVIGERPTENLAEAAATGEYATVVRLIGAGQSPAQVLRVRADRMGLPFMTPLEAAVLAEDGGLIQMFDRLGAIVGDDRRHLACLALDREEPRIADSLFPEGVTCEPGAAVALVRGRVQ